MMAPVKPTGHSPIPSLIALQLLPSFSSAIYFQRPRDRRPAQDDVSSIKMASLSAGVTF
jgi:hypothetical protein